MSQPLWSKTTLAQAVGLTVAGAGIVTTTDALAQDNQTPTLRISTYNLNVKTDDLEAKYASDGEGDTSNAYKIDLTVPLKDKWDVRLSAKKFDSDSDPLSIKYSSGSSAVTTTQSMNIDSSVIDFEVGHQLNLGSQDVRVFAGLRYVDLTSDLNISTNVKYNSGQFTMGYAQTNELKAYGLRAGAEGTMPLTKAFSVSGLAAVSAIHGDPDSDINTSFGYGTSLQTDSDTWYGADLEVALNWDPSPQTDGGPLISLGYTWSETADIMNTGFGNSNESDLTEQGGFVRLAFPL